MNQAFVTLLSSEDYLKAVLVLNNNLKQINSQYPLLVMVTDNIINNVQPYLEKENIFFKIVEYLHYSKEVEERDKGTYLLNIASKLSVFSLKEYDKIVFIDADSIFLSNIDDLFNYPDGAMYEEPGEFMGFAGMFVCCPRNHYLPYYLTIVQNFPIWESDLLGSLWFPFKTNLDYHIPSKYFVNITLENLNDISINKICGIHFCYYYKPWKYNSVEEYIKDYNKEFHGPHYNRKKIISFYFNQYLLPLKEKYPELF